MASSSGYWMSENTLSDKFPNGLRVLLVDDDQTCLTILEKMLRSCLYQVTKCNRAEAALALLRERKNDFDIVMSDVHMPDMDGFKLLEYVGLEMDLPVIMMSADDSKNVVMKGITHGACDYLIKPIRIEVIRTLWKHVFIKWKSEQRERPRTGDGVKEGKEQQKSEEEADLSSSVNEGDWRNSKKRKEEEEDGEDREERDDMPTSKKPRVVWSGELHQQFVDAVNQIGIDKAVPKKILELMNVPGITRENVASHLQKFRLYLKKMNEPTPQHQTGYRNPLVSPTGTTYGSSIPSLSMLDRQYHPFTGQLQAHRSRSSLMPGYDPRTLSVLRQNVGAFGGGVNLHGTMQGSQMSEYGSSQLHQILNIRKDYVPMPLSATMARNWVPYTSASQPSSTAHFPVQHNITGMSGGIPNGVPNGVHQDVKLDIERSRGFNSSYSGTGELMMHQDVSHALDTGKIALEVQQPYNTGDQAVSVPLLCDNSSMANADQRESSQTMFIPDYGHDELNDLLQDPSFDDDLRFPPYQLDGIPE